MQAKNSLICLLAALVALPLGGSVARATTIDIIQTFDYPEAETSTLPQKISDQLDLVGTTVSSRGVKGFTYKVRIQKFSPPLAPTFDNVSDTQGRGINSKRHICGEYLNGSDGTFHGYLLVSGLMNERIYTPYDIKRAVDTAPLGINNASDLAGAAILADGTQTAFVSVGGLVTRFTVPDAAATFAYMINTSNQTVGYYVDSGGVSHGFSRDSAGVLTYPIDVPGATETLLLGNNDSNWGVGRYTDASGVIHGLFYVTLGNMITYDYPGATFTAITGINKDGVLCGYYGDSTGLSHGFVAKVNLAATGQPNRNTQSAPVKPAYLLLPQLAGITRPAL